MNAFWRAAYWPRLRGLSSHGRDRKVDELVRFAFSGARPKIKPLQVQSEITTLVERVRALQPKTVLEIGTARGGTLFLFSRAAAEDATLVSVDLPGGKFGGGYSRARMPLFHAFAGPRQRVHLLRADSHADSTLATVRETLAGAPLDFLFIDGDHTYEGVKRDFERYAPLVRKGGLVALHDVADHFGDACDVRRFWLEVRERHPHEEIIADQKQGWAGIGLLFVR